MIDLLKYVTSEAMLREKHARQQQEILTEREPDNAALAAALHKAHIDRMRFTNRALATQNVWIKRFLTGGLYISPELEGEAKVSAKAHHIMNVVPEGHAFLPARPFPPAPIPEGMRVPLPPRAFRKMKQIPVDDMDYDMTHDEFVIRKGYVSPDGTIDDQSVVWDWENHLVYMKEVGEEPVVWPFWKAQNLGDNMIPDSWCAQYHLRVYQQFLEDSEPWSFFRRRYKPPDPGQNNWR
jgi:hypothetical protein